LANSGGQAAKRELQVTARGIAWNQAASRSRLIAAAAATCGWGVLAPRRLGRRRQAHVLLEAALARLAGAANGNGLAWFSDAGL